MNSVPLQPSEIRARNERAQKIIEDHKASSKQKSAARKLLTKEAGK